MRLPYIEVRRSTGGVGIHLYRFATKPASPRPIIASTPPWHCILEKMSRDCKFDFTANIDCFGGNMWIWHRKMSEANQGLALLKPATQLISEADLPANWRDEIERSRRRNRHPRPSPPPSIRWTTTSATPRTSGSCWTTAGRRTATTSSGRGQTKPFRRPLSPPRTVRGCCTSSPPMPRPSRRTGTTTPSAYALVNHNDDSKSAQSLETQGYGCKRFNLLTCDDLLDGDYTINYLIEKVLVAGQPCMIGGPQKGLKTSIMLDLGISLATGSPFLGRFPVTQTCKVVVLTGESGLGTIQDTVVRISKSKNVSVVAIRTCDCRMSCLSSTSRAIYSALTVCCGSRVARSWSSTPPTFACPAQTPAICLVRGSNSVRSAKSASDTVRD